MFNEGAAIIFIYLCTPTSRLHAEEYGGGGYKHVSSTFRNKEYYPMWLIQLPKFSEHAYLSTEHVCIKRFHTIICICTHTHTHTHTHDILLHIDTVH